MILLYTFRKLVGFSRTPEHYRDSIQLQILSERVPAAREWKGTFFPELVPKLLPYLRFSYQYHSPGILEPHVVHRRRVIIQTLYSCCLVCYYWNQVFTPALYQTLIIDRAIESNLLHTLWHVRPEYQKFVKVITIQSDLSPSGWTTLLTQFPNIEQLNINKFDLLQCPPKFSQCLRLLPRSCKIRIHGTTADTHRAIRFIKRTKLEKFYYETTFDVSCMFILTLSVKLLLITFSGFQLQAKCTLLVNGCQVHIPINVSRSALDQGNVGAPLSPIEDMSNYLKKLDLLFYNYSFWSSLFGRLSLIHSHLSLI